MAARRLIAPRILAPCLAVPVKEPLRSARGANSDSRLQILMSDRNLLVFHGISRKSGPRPSPETGSARHLSVTALSVKKTLMIR